MQIQRIPFPPIGSNMYVVTQGRDAIVLDPWPDETTMQCLQGYHVLLVLTHEHVDHISGLGRMQRALSARTLWQENCTPWLRNPGNTTPVLLAALSVSRGAEARDFLRTLQLKNETYAPDMTFGDHIVLDWGALHLEGYATPGHSRGSACYRIGPAAFSAAIRSCRATPSSRACAGATPPCSWTGPCRFCARCRRSSCSYPGHGRCGMSLGEGIATMDW
ncbi:MAG: MBL fold metallo-hydrolase [Oscillospiraceae bacterium]